MTKIVIPGSVDETKPEPAPTEPDTSLPPLKAADWGVIPSTDRRLHQRADEEAEEARMKPEHLDPLPPFQR